MWQRHDKMDEVTTATVALVIASLIWAIAGVAYPVLITDGLPAIFILWGIAIFRVITVWQISKIKKIEHVEIKDKREFTFIIINSIFTILSPLLFITALKYTKFSNAYFIFYTAPVWVFVVAVFLLGEKINIKKITGLLLTLGGLYFIASPEKILSLDPGFVFSLLCAFSYTGDIITSRELKDYPYHTVSFYTNIFMLIGLTILLVTTYEPIITKDLPLLITIIAALGILRGIASEFYYFALEKMEASKAAIITLTELLFASTLGIIFLNQFPNSVEIIGYALVIASIAIIVMRKSSLGHFKYLIHSKGKH